MPHQNSLLRFLSVDYGDLPSLSKISTSPTCSPVLKTKRRSIVFQPPGHPKQALIDEEIWPPIFTPELLRSAKRLDPKSTDVFVCTYPKCGTTWIQHICSQLMFNDYDPDIGKVAELCLTSPMIEKVGSSYVSDLQQPRLLKTHFSWQNCPKSTKAKYIYAVRNPKDCLTSYYFHNRNFKIYNWAEGDFDVFFNLFIEGRLAFGDYFKHLKSWLSHIHDPNVLFLKYEDMVKDLDETVQKIGEFLGGRARHVVDDKTLLSRVVFESKLDAMKENQERWFPGSQLHKKAFIRNGRVRDWKNYMSREQSDLFDAVFEGVKLFSCFIIVNKI